MDTFFKVYLIAILAVLAQCQMTERKGRPGGWHDVKVDDDGVQKVLQFAVTEHNQESNGEFMKVNRIVTARRQVVAGMKYNLKVDVSIYNCQVSDTENCQNPENSDQQKKRCTFEVLTVPWMNTTEVKRKRCYDRI
ncbi:cystatin-like [Pelobates fuscus]|uniref:cystatin-like n=1 Tax=Pelobates fuscus TaxID=191477 RepID=UPI002FE4B070